MIYYETELYHHGIKGQKWGVRRFQNKNGSLTTAGRKRYNDNYADTNIRNDRKNALKKRRSLSDEEIERRINRIKKEHELKRITEADISPGKAAVKRILKNSGEKIATAAVAGTGAYAVKVALTKKFDLKEFVSYTVPNPNKKK